MVVGLGTQDSFDQAQDFVREYGTTSFPMLWDESFESWLALGITGQPAAILFSPDGSAVEGWGGAFDEDRVIELAEAL